MVTRILVALVLATGVVAAADARSEPTALTFFVYDRNEKGHIVGQGGVDCLALRTDGAVVLGATNQQGEVTVSYSKLFQPDNLVVLFCRAGSSNHCAAVRLDVPYLREFAEYSVEITGPEIIDRFKVEAPDGRRRR